MPTILKNEYNKKPIAKTISLSNKIMIKYANIQDIIYEEVEKTNTQNYHSPRKHLSSISS